MKLAANSDFRASMKRVVDEMKKAGVDFTSKVRLVDFFMFLQSEHLPTGGNGGNYEPQRSCQKIIIQFPIRGL